MQQHSRDEVHVQSDQDNDGDRVHGKEQHDESGHIRGDRKIQVNVHIFLHDELRTCHAIHACDTRMRREQHHL